MVCYEMLTYTFFRNEKNLRSSAESTGIDVRDSGASDTL